MFPVQNYVKVHVKNLASELYGKLSFFLNPCVNRIELKKLSIFNFLSRTIFLFFAKPCQVSGVNSTLC